VVASNPVTHLRDAAEHDAFLLDVLAGAEREVWIVTPWIRANKIRQPRLWQAIQDAVRRGVAIHIYTDEELNVAGGDAEETLRNKEGLHALLEQLRLDGLHGATVRRVHSKIVSADGSIYCVGSFNWFSASRDEAYARHETSLVYRGPVLREEIEAVKASLEQRVIRAYPAAARP
jgi:phosphatidylserine/phosphatidylglycerophosphate/cardiolipin synthase-like enzyme